MSEVRASHSAPPPLSLSHHYSVRPSDPSVSPRRSHHSPSFSLPSLCLFPLLPHIDPFCSHLFVVVVVSWRMEVGGAVSCFLSVCVCVDSVGMCEKKLQTRLGRASECVCRTARTHGVGASAGHVAWS